MVDAAKIAFATYEHLILTYGALAVSISIAIPLAIAAIYSKRLASIVITFANIVQAVPSFAVVAMAVPLLGIGFIPALFAIVLRTLLPIVRNTYIGMAEVDEAIIDAARGMGMTEFQIIRYIRLPNAYLPMFAGIKFAAILANSIAILTAIIGSGGLGRLIFEGLASFNMEKVLAGAIPAILIAIFIDVSFTKIEKSLAGKAQMSLMG